MKTLLRKYWEGTITEEEKKELLRLLGEAEIDISKTDKSKFLLQDDLTSEDSLEKEKFEGLLQNIHQEIFDQKNDYKKNNITRCYWYWAAACLLLIMGTLIYWFVQPFKAKYERNYAEVRKENDVLKTNESDSSIQFYLPDSSLVQLKNHSSLKYYWDYNQHKREIVLLNGCAHFEVAKNPQKPFIVVYKGLITTAIGTAFSVNSYQLNKTVIRLFHGKISVQGILAKGKNIPLTYLSPGETLAVSITGDLHLEKEINNTTELKKTKTDSVVEKKVKDRNSSLTFNRTPVSEVFENLSHFYHIDIECNKKDLSDLWFTGSFNHDASLEEILFTICNLNDLSYTKEENKIIIQTN